MIRFLALLALLSSGDARPTCNIPVFRYALERWPAAPYEVLAFHRGPLTDPQIEALTVLRQSGANLEVDRINVAEPVPSRRRPLLDRLQIEAPALVALYPGTEQEAWRGPLSADAARELVDSPLRRDIASRLLGGQSVVWILLESGEKGKDDAAQAVLSGELSRLERSLSLPRHHPDDPPLRSDVPVKVAFSLLRLSRTDPHEQPLVSLLKSSESNLFGPVAFPLFGRGRILWAMAGAGLQGETISEAAAFLTGACACEAKEFNPGLDLLFATDWEDGLSAAPERERLPEPILQPRPPEAPEPGASPPKGAGVVLWTALVGVGLLVLVSGRRILVAGRGPRSE